LSCVLYTTALFLATPSFRPFAQIQNKI